MLSSGQVAPRIRHVLRRRSCCESSWPRSPHRSTVASSTPRSSAHASSSFLTTASSWPQARHGHTSATTVRSLCARDEDGVGRHGAATQDLRGLRDRRGHRGPGRGATVADLRHRRGRPDRGRAAGQIPRWRCGASRANSAGTPRRRPGPPGRRGKEPLANFGHGLSGRARRARGDGGRLTWACGSWVWTQRAWTSKTATVSGPASGPVRRSGQPASRPHPSPPAGEVLGRGGRPGGSGQGEPRPVTAGAPRGVRRRGHDVAARSPRGGRGRHAGGAARRQHDRARPEGEAVGPLQVPRSGTRPPWGASGPSPASAGSG